jgi:hypothetical protein
MSCHGIRHTVATHLLKNKAELREVQELLGHSKIRHTERYTHLFPDDLRDVITHLSPVSKIRTVYIVTPSKALTYRRVLCQNEQLKMVLQP